MYFFLHKLCRKFYALLFFNNLILKSIRNMLQKFQSYVLRIILNQQVCALRNHNIAGSKSIIIITDYFNKYTTMHPFIVIMMMRFQIIATSAFCLVQFYFMSSVTKWQENACMYIYIFCSLKLCLSSGVVWCVTLLHNFTRCTSSCPQERISNELCIINIMFIVNNFDQ